MSAFWHVEIEDPARLAVELRTLDGRACELDEAIRGAVYRQRYSSEPEETAKGADDLWHLVSELNRLMTRVRAVEAKLLLLRKKAEPVATGLKGPGEREIISIRIGWGDVSADVSVEVHRDLPLASNAGSIAGPE